MIILGDIAVPDEKFVLFFDASMKQLQSVFGDEEIIGNLEGLITGNSNLNTNTPILFNSPSLVSSLKDHNFKVLCLANNHTLDNPQDYALTKELLNNAGMAVVGAGENADLASKPAYFRSSDGFDIYVFNFCWSFLLYHQNNPAQGKWVSEIEREMDLESITNLKKDRPEAKVIVYFHWNFDFETLPMPVFRKWSHLLVDAGADWVVGTHSHCVQGAEKYKNGYIHYGLGNFYIPHSTYVNGTLDYPDFALTELAVSYNFTDEPVHHWVKYRKETRQLQYLRSEKFSTDDELHKLSPFSSMSEADYEKYFKVHRRKSILVPVFEYEESESTYRLKMQVLKTRAKLARFLAANGLRKWNN